MAQGDITGNFIHNKLPPHNGVGGVYERILTGRANLLNLHISYAARQFAKTLTQNTYNSALCRPTHTALRHACLVSFLFFSGITKRKTQDRV